MSKNHSARHHTAHARGPRRINPIVLAVSSVLTRLELGELLASAAGLGHAEDVEADGLKGG